MSKVIIPGSFDPITLGHLDIIKRSSILFDEVYVVIGINTEKKYILSDEKRLEYVCDAVNDFPNVKVLLHKGLIVDAAHDIGADFIVKGVRNASDLEYENRMADVNRELSLKKRGKIFETVYLPASLEYVHTSSSLVRELISMNLPFDKYVHNPVLLSKLIENI